MKKSKLQKQFNIEIIGILEEIDSFYCPKCTHEKVTKNWAGPAPSFGQNPKEQQFFLVRLSLRNIEMNVFPAKITFCANVTFEVLNVPRGGGGVTGLPFFCFPKLEI